MNSQILAIEKFIPKELCSLYIVLKNELPTSQNIFATFSQFTFSPISYHVKFQLTPIYVCSNIKYWTMFYISINSFLFFLKKILNCVLTVDYKMKQSITFLLNVNLLSNYGVTWDIIVNVALIFQQHTTIIQILYLLVKRLFKAFICSPIEKC